MWVSKLKTKKAYSKTHEIKLFNKVLYAYKENFYYLKEPLIYGGYTVQANTITNFASVPILVRKWFNIKPQSRGYSKSSVLHDDLYIFANKFKADWLFLKAMKDEQKELLKDLAKKYGRLKLSLHKTKWLIVRWSFYIGVSLFGWGAYLRSHKHG